MLRNGYVIKDAREDANVAYEEDSNPRLQNPVDTGHHRLLVADGEFRDVCIGIAPKALGRGQVQVALVVDKETGDFGYWWPEQLWVDPKTDLPKEDDDGYFNKLPGIESVKPNQVYAIITPRRRMSVAFKVVAKNRTKNGTLELSVQPIVGDPGIKPSGTLPYRDGDLSQFGEGPHLPFVGEGVGKSEIPTASQDLADGSADTDDATYTNLSHIVVQKNSHKMSIVRKSLFVPDNAKVIKLSGGKSLQTWAMADPASLSDVASGFLKTNCERVRFLKNSGQVYINDTGPFDRVSAIKNLVKNVGLREKQAVHIVDRLKDGKRSSVLVKNNVGFAPGFPEQEMGYDNYADVPVQFQQDEEVPVDMPMGPFDGYLGKPEIKQLTNAARTGEKDVFDTSAIASLVKTIDSEDLITQYLSDIILGLDRVCRVLFMYYWLNEQFRERYGQENMVELEDQLKNVVKSLGDLVLFLKQRQVEGSPSYSSMEIDLGVN